MFNFNTPAALKKFLRRITYINTVLFIVASIMILMALTMKTAHGDVWQHRHSPPKLRPTKGSITVMVVDTGVTPNNPVISPYLVKPVQIQDVDTHGHGTHVTSLIVGGAGTMRKDGEVHFSSLVCPEVRVIACKFYDPKAITKINLDNSIACFQKALELNVDIVNYSAGGPDSLEEERLAIEKLQENDIILVTAAGNEGSDLKIYPYYPANYQLKNMVIVGALGLPPNKFNAYQRFKSSNFGIFGMYWEIGEAVLGYNHLNKPQYMTGTSQATALATNRILRQRCEEMKQKDKKEK
jgi:subtilisin family serine protease